MPQVTSEIKPDYILITNFFRDQLDRYGEVENTIKKVHDSIKNHETILILNSDNPSCLYFNDLPNPKIYYSHCKTENSTKNVEVQESVFCPICGTRLKYDYVNYGNTGQYQCPKCKTTNPNSDYTIKSMKTLKDQYQFTVTHKNEIRNFKTTLIGTYNLYNCLAVISLAKELGLTYETIKNKIANFTYKLGRMEKITINEKEILLVLSKNPIGLTESLTTFSINPNEKSIMFILNDYPADGEDISWIWDANFEKILQIPNISNFYCAGTRAEDAAVRLKYTGFPLSKIKIYQSKDRFDIENPINHILKEEKKPYIIGTFTGMPEARRILMKKQARTLK